MEQYPGGEASRAAEIEAGAHRPAAELVEDFRAAAAALATGWEALPEPAWDRETVTLHGRRPVRDCVLARWREVEVHRADLGLGVTPADWTSEFVAVYLPRRQLLAWLLGRGADGIEITGCTNLWLAWQLPRLFPFA